MRRPWNGNIYNNSLRSYFLYGAVCYVCRMIAGLFKFISLLGGSKFHPQTNSKQLQQHDISV
jgi:hypothetical protein